MASRRGHHQSLRRETHYPWRAVDQDGNVLDILVQSQRKAKAATRFFKRLLKGLRYAPRVMISDKLASYGAARKQMRLSIEHRQHKLDENTYVDAAFLRGSEPRQAPGHRIAAA